MPVNSSAKQNIISEIAGGRFAKRSFLLIASQVIRLIAQVAVIFVYARHLSLKDYGIYQSVWLYTNIISVLSLFGLPALILSTHEKNIRTWIKENKKSFLTIAGIVTMLPLLFLFTAA